MEVYEDLPINCMSVRPSSAEVLFLVVSALILLKKQGLSSGGCCQGSDLSWLSAILCHLSLSFIPWVRLDFPHEPPHEGFPCETQKIADALISSMNLPRNLLNSRPVVPLSTFSCLLA